MRLSQVNATDEAETAVAVSASGLGGASSQDNGATTMGPACTDSAPPTPTAASVTANWSPRHSLSSRQDPAVVPPTRVVPRYTADDRTGAPSTGADQALVTDEAGRSLTARGVGGRGRSDGPAGVV